MYLTDSENLKQRQFQRIQSCQNQNMNRKQEIKSKNALYFGVISASKTC